MEVKDSSKFSHLRECGIISAMEVVEVEDTESADLLCAQLPELMEMDPVDRRAFLGRRPLPSGFLSARYRSARTGETYGESFRIDGSPITILSMVVSIATSEHDFGKFLSARRGPTRDKGYLELLLLFEGN